MPSSQPAPPLRKFTVNASNPAAPGSALYLALSSSSADALPLSTLALLRSTLFQSRTLATERLIIRDSNRRNLGERQAALNRSLAEAAKLKDVERKRKRDDDERREKERDERGDKVSRGRLPFTMTTTPESNSKSANTDQVELKLMKEEEYEETLRLKKETFKVDRVLALVKVNESGEGAGRVNHDTKIYDGRVTIPLATSIPHTNGSSIPSASRSMPSDATSLKVSEELQESETHQPARRKLQEKKRKRDNIVIDSDDDSSVDSSALDDPSKKIRKIDDHSSRSFAATGTPLPNVHFSHSASVQSMSIVEKSTAPGAIDSPEGLSYLRQKLAEDKFSKHSIPTRPPAPGTAAAFYIPQNSLVPPQPISIPPVPTPKRQSEVAEDFSRAKPGTQIAFHTFHSWAEAYLRPFGEDDLAFLAPRPDDLMPYAMPSFGKYYVEKWEEEDYATTLALAPDPSSFSSTLVHHYSSPLDPPPLPRLRPDHLTEEALGMENVFVGPLTERVVAALAFGCEEGRSQLADSEMRGKDASGDARGEKEERKAIDAVELEERIKKELRFIGILGEDEPNWCSRSDDLISSSLRACQRLLHSQTSLNESRKSILTSIVKDRMGYQEYEATRDVQERVIENGWNKRQRGPGSKKKGKKDRDKLFVPLAASASATTSSALSSATPILNGVPISEVKPPVSPTLLAAIQTREDLVGQFKGFFEREEEEGRFFGIPEESIFSEIHEAVEDSSEEEEEDDDGDEDEEEEEQKEQEGEDRDI